MHLVCLDFSGTLSLGAVMFGRKARLEKALRHSGLWKLGIKSTEVFWEELVNPTWEIGSTTTIGYSVLLAQQADQALRARGRYVQAALLEQSAARFVRSYLLASSIHPAWRPTLRYLYSRMDVVLLIATDHYAEATSHIVEQLSQFGLWTGTGPHQRVLVANSADIGAHKESAPYWMCVQSLLPAPPQQVILVDDFGANEQPLDAYANPAEVARRQEATTALLQRVFGTAVIVRKFVLAGRQRGLSYKRLLELYRREVMETHRFLQQTLGSAARA